MFRHCVGVIGTGELARLESAQRAVAEELGEAIARAGWILMSGTGSGVPDITAAAAARAGGVAIGVSPAANRVDHLALGLAAEPYLAVVYTGFGFKGRNVVLVRSSDVLVAVGGGIGTLNEITIAVGVGKPVVLIRDTGGVVGLIAESQGLRGLVGRDLAIAKTVEEAVGSIATLLPPRPNP